jgi:hypothetical protein
MDKQELYIMGDYVIRHMHQKEGTIYHYTDYRDHYERTGYQPYVRIRW